MRLTEAQREILRNARESAGLLQSDIAERIGVSGKTISRAEKDGTGIGERVLEDWCRVLGVAFTASRPAEIGELKQ